MAQREPARRRRRRRAPPATRPRALGVDDEESRGLAGRGRGRWRIPYNDELGVHEQAAGFTGHQQWDFEHTAPDQYPLLLHFPYFDLYRKQVVKQADLVLAMYLRGDVLHRRSRRPATSPTTSR